MNQTNLFFKIFFFINILLVSNLLSYDFNLTQEERDYVKNNTVKIGVEQWAPFLFSNNGSDIDGICGDFTKLIIKRTGLKTTIVIDEWVELLKGIENKTIDFLPDVFRTPKREKYGLFSDGFFKIKDAIHLKDTNTDIHSLKDLEGKILAMQKGNGNVDKIQNKFPKIKIIFTADLDDSINRVLNGEVDAFYAGQIAVETKVNNELIKGLKSISIKAFNAPAIHFFSSLDKPLLASILQKGLQSITYQERNNIFNKWLDKANKIKDKDLLNLTSEQKEYLKNKKVITVHNESDWPPYNYNINNQPRGFSIDYMNLLSEKLGIKVKYISGHSWSEFIEMIKDEKLDVMLNIKNTKNRAEFINFTTDYVQSLKYIYTNNPNIKTIADLNGKTVSVEKNFFTHKYLAQNYPNIKLNIQKNSLSTILSVLAGKADAIIADSRVITFLLQKYGLSFKYDQVIMYNEIITKLNIGTSLKQSILRDILQKAMDKVTSKEVLYLREKWFRGMKISDKIKLSQAEEQYLENKQVLKMCADPSWMPFEKIENGTLIGLSADYMKIISKKINTPIALMPTKTWVESLEKAKNRECDILTLVSMTKKRKKYMDFTKPYRAYPTVIATRSGTPFINNLENILDKKLGVTKGYSLYGRLKKQYPNINLVIVDSIKDGLEKVKDGKIFGYLDNSIVLNYEIQKYYIGILNITGNFKSKTIKLAIATRNDEPLLNQIIQKAIDSIDTATEERISNLWIINKYDNGDKLNYTLLLEILIIVLIIIIAVIYRQWLLRKQNQKLLKIVEKKTKDLKEINENLENKIEIRTKDLEIQKERAQKATQSKSDFLANMSHEIRTPINGIVGMTHLIQQTNLNNKQKHYVETIEISSSNLLNIINDILDFSKIEAGKLNIEKINFNIKELIDNISNIVNFRAKEKNINFSISCNNNVGIYLFGDPWRISQILMNLVNNAIKFTDIGFVKVSISSQNDIFKFDIIDSGIGITEEQQKNLFQSFNQADASTTRKYGGTGLGLLISKQLVELMGGKIWVVSEEHKGTTFSFELKLEKSKQDIDDTFSPKYTIEEIKTLQISKILLVEDNIINQEIVIGLLEESQIKICTAINGLEAIELYHKNDYDLILMDLQMPIMDGFKATKIIREIDKNIPIIALTANAMKEGVLQTKEIGMDGHLNKPIIIDKFYAILMKYLSKKSDKSKTPPIPKDVNFPILSIFTKINTNLGLSLMNKNQKLYLKILNNFYTEYKDMKLEKLCVEEFQRITHTLKGLSANIGATDLSQIATELDKSQNKDLLPKFYKEFNAVLGELKDFQLIYQQKNKTILKTNHQDVEKLFAKLKKALISKKPKEYKPIIEEIEKYELNLDKKNLFQKIRNLVKKYKIKDAINLMELENR